MKIFETMPKDGELWPYKYNRPWSKQRLQCCFWAHYRNLIMIGWCIRQQEALPIWLKPGIWLIMQSRMARLTWEKVAPNQKGAIFQRRKKAKPKPYTNKTNPINPGDTPHTKITQTISPITQTRVIKHLPWFLTIHLPITKHKLYKHTYLSKQSAKLFGD